jgi:predicted nucleic acid-binding protein
VAIELRSLELTPLPVVSAISSLTLAELKWGPWSTMDLTERIRRQRHLAAIQVQITVLPFGVGCAEAYGRVHAAVAAIGRKPRGRRALDLAIAASACAYRLPLYTLNASDLVGLEALVEIIDLSDGQYG